MQEVLHTWWWGSTSVLPDGRTLNGSLSAVPWSCVGLPGKYRQQSMYFVSHRRDVTFSRPSSTQEITTSTSTQAHTHPSSRTHKHSYLHKHILTHTQIHTRAHTSTHTLNPQYKHSHKAQTHCCIYTHTRRPSHDYSIHHTSQKLHK